MVEKVIEVRWHGRGGQGAVVASMILAKAAFYENYWSQAFPFFGAERRGAPIMAFTRLSKEPIKLRSQVYEPDILVVLDPMLAENPLIWKGFKDGGIVVVNTIKRPEEIELGGRPSRIGTVDATKIAIDLGLVTEGLPKPNTAIVGALSRVTGLVSLDHVKKAIIDTLGGRIAESNVKAAELAYNDVKIAEL